jgi:hypothetical protein
MLDAGTDRDDEIRQIAYRLWQEEGCPRSLAYDREEKKEGQSEPTYIIDIVTIFKSCTLSQTERNL